MKLPLLLAAALLLGSAVMTAQRHYAIGSFITLKDTTIVDHPSDGRRMAALEARLSARDPLRLHEGGSPVSATLSAGDISLVIRRFANMADNVYDGACIRLTLCSGDSVIAESDCRDLASRPGAQVSYAMEMRGDTLTVLAGKDELKRRMAVDIGRRCLEGPASLSAAGTVDATIFVTEMTPVSREERLAGLPPTEVGRLLSEHGGGIVGSYAYLDRSTDPAVARPGGRYRLAVVPDPDGTESLLIIYIAGAEVEPSFWKPGMLKGILRPTPFEGQYDLVWYDAHGAPIPYGSDSYALFDSAASILTLNFPLLGQASVRFARQ